MLHHRLTIDKALVMLLCAFKARPPLARRPHAGNAGINIHVAQVTRSVVFWLLFPAIFLPTMPYTYHSCFISMSPLSVGEVQSGLVPGHFCWTGDWTVWSLTKFLGPGPGPPWTVYIGLVPVQTRSRPSPCMFGTTGAASVAYWGSFVCWARRHSRCMSAWRGYSQGALRSMWGMGEANSGP